MGIGEDVLECSRDVQAFRRARRGYGSGGCAQGESCRNNGDQGRDHDVFKSRASLDRCWEIWLLRESEDIQVPLCDTEYDVHTIVYDVGFCGAWEKVTTRGFLIGEKNPGPIVDILSRLIIDWHYFIQYMTECTKCFTSQLYSISTHTWFLGNTDTRVWTQCRYVGPHQGLQSIDVNVSDSHVDTGQDTHLYSLVLSNPID